MQDTAWGHKYFCLLFPDRVSDIHVIWHQQLQLIRLLEIPPKPLGRYVCEGRYVAVAGELGLPLHTMASVIYRRNGPLRNYWRLDLAEKSQRWELMRAGPCLALGWPEIGDVSAILPSAGAKEEIKQRVLEQLGPVDSASRIQQLMNLGKAMNEGDCVVVTDGDRALGIGRISGPYTFDGGSPFPHRRTVEWQNLDPWPFPRPQSAKRPLDQIDYRLDAASLVAIERRLLDAGGKVIVVPPSPTKNGTLRPPPPLTGTAARIQEALERKGQVIVYGPPGTGKTYWAIRTARELAARSHFGASFDALTASQQSALLGDAAQPAPAIRVCTFHPGYGYEDFIEGYRPVSQNGQMLFEQRAGIFKQLCADAARQPHRSFYLIIDEINRGDVPRIFGELLTLLEKDKRGLSVILPASGHRFHVPDNILVIGTMNTADRSIALLDTALRRRFAFVELLPDIHVIGDTVVDGIPLGPWLQALNQRIRAHIGRDARNLQIGHAYLLDQGQPLSTFPALTRALRDDILPLLEEYCYENYTVLAQVLGSGLVDATQQRFHDELFDATRHDDLVQALLEPSPEISTSPQAIQASASDEVTNAEETDNADEAGA